MESTHLPAPPSCQADDNLPQHFENPGLPEHQPRRTDTDPKAAKRAERQVSLLFVLAMVAGVGFVVAYFAIRITDPSSVMHSTQALGVALAVLMLCIGFGAVHWAKQLMPDHEQVEQRHAIASTPAEQEAAGQVILDGGQATGFGRRKMIWGSMVGAMSTLPLVGAVPLWGLITNPRNRNETPPQAFSHTVWKPGMRLLTDPDKRPIRPEDVPIGGVIHVIPEVLTPNGTRRADVPADALNEHNELSLNALAKAVVLVMRIAPADLKEPQERKNWSVGGIVAYSKICTHVGCPIALLERTTNHLLCPCHQSTFDATDQCKVIFGPANRALPQLPIAVDSQGYLIAQSDFTEPVGPSFWERG